MSWDLHPDGVDVVADIHTKLGLNFAQVLVKRGFPLNVVMRVKANKMIDDPDENWPSGRRTPKITLTLPDKSEIETEPAALNRAE